jgi:hypothetical protein
VAALSSADLLPPTIDATIDMKCTGYVPPLSNYSFTKQCGLMEIYSTLYECFRVNANKYNFFTSNNIKFTNIIYNLPTSCPLGFALSDRNYNVVWIQQVQLLNINLTNTLAHEMGHTRGLYHSAAFGSDWEYADCSCPMGCAKDINVCFNAPNANRLGWAKPIVLDNNIINNWMEVYLPIYTTSFYNHVMIKVTDDCSLYFSVRSAVGPDSGISGLSVVNIHQERMLIENTVNIHAMNSSYLRPMAVDFIPAHPSKIWLFRDIATRVCGSVTTFKNIAVLHHMFSPQEQGSYVSFCFYKDSVDNCF